MKSKRSELSSEFNGPSFPVPLASRRFCKRKRTIEFLFDAQPPTSFHLSTDFPSNPLLSSQTQTSAPVEKEVISQAVRSSSILDFKSLDSEKDAASSIQSNVNREPAVMEVTIPENDKVENSFSISALVPPSIPPQPSSPAIPKSETLTGGTAKIIESLQILGRSTVHQVANWISKRYGEALLPKKKLSYIVNSILSNKKNASLFVKESAVIDGHKKTIWRLVDEDVHDMLSPLEYEDVPIIVDDAAMQAFEEQEKEEEEPIEIVPSPPKPQPKRDKEAKRAMESAKRKREDEDKEAEQTIQDEPKLRSLTPTKEPEEPKSEKPAQRSSKKSYESESDAAEAKQAPMIVEPETLKEPEHVSPPKAKRTKVKQETAEDEPKPDKPEEVEQYGSFDDLSELDRLDKGSEDWRKRAKSRIKSYSSRRKNKVDDDTASPSASPSFPAMHSETTSNNNSTYNSEDSMDPEGSTYTEMIEQALRALGGRGTGTEITSYIDENYHDVLSNKTKTWKNSVMGCLSANRRKLFAKEPVKEHAKRYVWRLNDPSLNLSPPEPLSPVLNSPTDTSPPPNHKKRKSTSPHIKVEPEPVEEKTAPAEDKEDDDVAELPRRKMEKKKEQKEPKEKQPEEEKKEEISPEAMEEEEESDNEDFEESAEEPRKAKRERKKKGGDDKSLISLIETALSALGGSGTGMEVTEWILERKDEAMVSTVIAADLCANKKKLNYTVNATLSSKKYRNIFMKDTSSTTGRAVWKLTNKK